MVCCVQSAGPISFFLAGGATTAAGPVAFASPPKADLSALEHGHHLLEVFNEFVGHKRFLLFICRLGGRGRHFFCRGCFLDLGCGHRFCGSSDLLLGGFGRGRLGGCRGCLAFRRQEPHRPRTCLPPWSRESSRSSRRKGICGCAPASWGACRIRMSEPA